MYLVRGLSARYTLRGRRGVAKHGSRSAMLEEKRRSNAASILIVACGAGLLPHASVAALGAPLIGQAGAGLVAPGGVDELAKPRGQLPPGAQKMGDNFSKAGTSDAAPAPGAAPPAVAAAVTNRGVGLMTEIPMSYVLLILLVGLAGFVICRPSGRRAIDD